MRKRVPSGDCFVGEAIYQTVVPVKFCGLVLGAFHGGCCRRFVGRCLPVSLLVAVGSLVVGRCLPVSPLVIGCRRFVGRWLPSVRWWPWGLWVLLALLVLLTLLKFVDVHFAAG